jgi:uncharacterized protein YjbI with pentapeptide repeats
LTGASLKPLLSFKLETLNLQECSKLTAKEVGIILEQLTALQSLNVRRCHDLFSEELFKSCLPRLPSLTDLNVAEAYKSFSDEHVALLPKFNSNLRTLSLERCKLSGASLPSLLQLTRLTSLNLTDTFLHYDDVSELKQVYFFSFLFSFDSLK